MIHKQNGGVSSARNVGIRAATGDILGFVDADDWCEKDMFGKLAERLEHADAAVCGFYDYPYGLEYPIPKGKEDIPSCGYERAVYQIMARDCYYPTLWNKFFRRGAIGDVLFDETLRFGEDEIWLLQALKRCQRITFFPEPLYHWRKREGSITRFSHVSATQLSLLKAKEISFKLIPQTPEIQLLARSKMFNDCFFIKLQAYCTEDWENYRKVAAILKPYKAPWLKCYDTPLMRKAKVLAMELEMALRFPGGIVRFTDNIKKMHR